MDELSLNNREGLRPSSLMGTTSFPFSNTQHIASIISSSANSPRDTDTSPLLRGRVTPSKDLIRDIDPRFIAEFFGKVDESGHPYIIVYSPKEEVEEDVSEDFVKEFNEHYGSASNIEKARRLLDKMKKLGGLTGNQELSSHNDIPAARMGLCILAGLNHEEFKFEALDSLMTLLKKDPVTSSSSIQLIPLTIKLMKTLNNELIQSERIESQAKIAEAYNLSVELIQRHYYKKHINAITQDLKVQLVKTTSALKDLNRQEDAKLAFHAQAALEGIRRIVDDEKELYDVLGRFYHLVAAAGIGLTQNDGATVLSEIALTFKDLDPHIKKSWYNGMLIFKELGKEAMSDPKKLEALQAIIAQKYHKYSWKYTYAAQSVLTDIVINGKTESIRNQAFGLNQPSPELPGIISFADCEKLNHKRDYKQLKHFKAPHMKDPNIRVRHGCIENLINIAQNSPDSAVRLKARQVLAKRLTVERDQNILSDIVAVVPTDPELRMIWLKDDRKLIVTS
jgi:hypothetical protein